MIDHGQVDAEPISQFERRRERLSLDGMAACFDGTDIRQVEAKSHRRNIRCAASAPY
jgi:hypothetical protein